MGENACIKNNNTSYTFLWSKKKSAWELSDSVQYGSVYGEGGRGLASLFHFSLFFEQMIRTFIRLPTLGMEIPEDLGVVLGRADYGEGVQ